MIDRTGFILLSACKDPRNTVLKAKTPCINGQRILTRKHMREPRLIVAQTRVRGGSAWRVESVGLISWHVKKGVLLARAESEGWGNWPAEYRIVSRREWEHVFRKVVYDAFAGRLVHE